MPTMIHDVSGQRFPETQFVVSPVVEMLMSLESLVSPVRFPEFRAEVRERLGSSFVEEVRDIYRMFHGGNDFIEFAMETRLSENVDAFIARVATMDPRHFTFLVLGRLYSEDALPEPITRSSLETFLDRIGARGATQHVGSDFSWADDLARVRDRLVSIWQRFRMEYFDSWYERTTDARQRAIDEKHAEFERLGSVEFFRSQTSVGHLPRQIPDDCPYESILYTPVSMYQEVSRFFYGYGVIVVPFDAADNAERQARQDARRHDLSRIFRALSDPGRLRILEVIAGSDYSFNGQKVAWRVNLSTSVVSRHLKQLREAGLIDDHSPDKRNTLYRVRLDTIERLSGDLIRYVNRE
jgi:ArsR family transcriptional regulator